MAASARTVSDTLSAELGIDAGGDAGVGVAAAAVVVVAASSMNAGGGGRCSLELWQLELW